VPPVLASRVRIPDLGKPPTNGTEIALHEEIDRRDKILPPKPPQKIPGGRLQTIDDPTGRMFSNSRQQEMVAAGWVWSAGVWTGPAAPVAVQTVSHTQTQPHVPTTTTTTTGGSMDLGSIITDLGTAYINSRYPTPTPVSTTAPIPVQPAYDLFDAGSDVIDFFTAPDGSVVPVKKKKKCRRRRRRLATVSDIKDLAALRSVLGNGEAFKTWIATHSR